MKITSVLIGNFRSDTEYSITYSLDQVHNPVDKIIPTSDKSVEVYFKDGKMKRYCNVVFVLTYELSKKDEANTEH